MKAIARPYSTVRALYSSYSGPPSISYDQSTVHGMSVAGDPDFIANQKPSLSERSPYDRCTW
jgi:hypothetical protein